MGVVDLTIDRHSSCLHSITPNYKRYLTTGLILGPMKVEEAAVVRCHYD